MAAAAAVYFGVRHLTSGESERAVRDANRLTALERALGVDWEVSLQRAAFHVPLLPTVANWIYIYGHWPFIIVVLTWLVIWHRPVFLRARNAMLISGAIGIVVYATYPVAPPRLARTGLVDTVTQRSNSYRVLQPAGFTDEYAAMPSLHAGWNLIVSLAMIAATRSALLRIFAVAATLAMDMAVLVTANHYVLDVVAGLALTGGLWLVVGPKPPRPRHRQRRRRQPRAPAPRDGGLRRRLTAARGG
ncbi:phosphatase PAP2 family protein [Phytohabitans suffuscus]|nr:phosphatase PAP2 family protein [Phytohabitans suffuscus]